MVDLLSEEEQWERLKAWLRTNGVSVLVLAAVMLLGWFGWQWWQEHREGQSLAAADVYHSILADFDAGKRDAAYASIERLRSEYPDSAYTSAADLAAANVHVNNNELDQAEERLARVAASAADEQLRPIAKLRLARVQAAKGDYDKALATVGTENLGLHEAGRLEVRGDVLLAKGDREGALKEYLASRQALPAVESQDGGVAELLDLKIADLGGAPASSEDAAAAPAAGTASAPTADAAAAPAAAAAPVETP